MFYQAGLVLEGGGMKGVYTSGVLDFFLDKELEFAKCYGVSAGSCSMCSYLSKQRGRSYATTTDYLKDKNYCSVSSLLRTGNLFNVDMCYRQIPDSLNPFAAFRSGRQPEECGYHDQRGWISQEANGAYGYVQAALPEISEGI